MKKYLNIVLIVFVMLVAFNATNAQSFTDDVTDVDGSGGTGGSTEVPIDGGLSLLLGAGIAYGAKRAYNSRNKSIK